MEEYIKDDIKFHEKQFSDHLSKGNDTDHEEFIVYHINKMSYHLDKKEELQSILLF